jgi:hypothetical protein
MRRKSNGSHVYKSQKYNQAVTLGITMQCLEYYLRRGYTLEQLAVIGLPGRFTATLKPLWPMPDRSERYRLIMMWRKMDIPLRVCGELLGMTRERVRQIEASKPNFGWIQGVTTKGAPRKNRLGVGRPATYVLCINCQEAYSLTEIRKHSRECPAYQFLGAS